MLQVLPRRCRGSTGPARARHRPGRRVARSGAGQRGGPRPRRWRARHFCPARPLRKFLAICEAQGGYTELPLRRLPRPVEAVRTGVGQRRQSPPGQGGQTGRRAHRSGGGRVDTDTRIGDRVERGPAALHRACAVARPELTTRWSTPAANPTSSPSTRETWREHRTAALPRNAVWRERTGAAAGCSARPLDWRRFPDGES